ncbi:septum site-determining protein MinC [Thalassobacillus sp. C254]|nr:septum site-determining protein MinC [Thalassobacillus sp. C254]
MKEESSITSIARIIRSGQVLRIQGDALLLGDINPGGTVEATGNVFVMGTLKGTVRAGVDGNEDTVICASVMEPNQLSIGNTIYYAPDRYEDEKDNEYTNEEPVYAYIHRETKEVAFEKTRQLGQLYPHVANGTFEGL